MLSLRNNLIINVLLGVLSYFTIYLLFVLLFHGTAPNIADSNCRVIEFERFCQPSAIEDHEVFQVILDSDWMNRNESNISLEKFQFFYYDILHGTDAFTAFSFGMGQPLFVGGASIAVEKFDRNAFELFGTELEILAGRNFIIEDFVVFNGYFPILLGYEFYEHNEVGDRFTALYFGLEQTFEVIGILAPHQFQGGSNSPRLLDIVLVMPFVSRRYFSEDPQELSFWEEIYRNLAYSLILVENTPDAIDTAINILNAGSEEIGIPYFLTSMGEHIPQTIEVRNLVRHQREVMMILFANIAFIMSVVIMILMSIKYRMREKTYNTLMLNGVSKWKLLTPIILETVLIFSIVFLIVNEYLVFDSGFLSRRELLTDQQLIQFLGENSNVRWFVYRFTWSENHTMLYLLLYTVVLCMISLIFPVIKLKKLYKKGW